MAEPNLKLTTRGRHAVSALVELGRRGAKQPVRLYEIAEQTRISLSYLEQLFSGLRRQGLVRSYRGPGGGYILARPPDQILLVDILAAAEDCVAGRKTAHDDSSGCALTGALWGYIGRAMYVTMRHVSLDDVVESRVPETPTLRRLLQEEH